MLIHKNTKKNPLLTTKVVPPFSLDAFTRCYYSMPHCLGSAWFALSLLFFCVTSTSATDVFIVFEVDSQSLNKVVQAPALAANLSDALLYVMLLSEYSILNRDDNYVPFPVPPPRLVVGALDVVLQSGKLSKPLRPTTCVVQLAMDTPAAVAALLSFANLPRPSSLFVGNPIQAMGIRGAQLSQPTDVKVGGMISTNVTIASAVGSFLVMIVVSILASKQRLVREARGVNFNTIIRLEEELMLDALKDI